MSNISLNESFLSYRSIHILSYNNTPNYIINLNQVNMYCEDIRLLHDIRRVDDF